jgi:hypothetical protein
MNVIEVIKKLGNNEQLETKEFYLLTDFLINYKTKSKQTVDAYKLYIEYLLDNYNGNDKEINKFVSSLFKKRSDGYFYSYGDFLNNNTFKKITDYEKHKYFLEPLFENPTLYGVVHSNNISGSIIFEILNSLKTTEDKEKFCIFLMKKTNFYLNNDSIGLLSKLRFFDFLKYSLNNYKIETQKGRDIANIIIKSNGEFNDSFIYQISLKNISPFEQNIHNIIFQNYMFTENNLDIIFGTDNISMLLHIISQFRFDSNYKLKKQHFVILLKQHKFTEIFNLMSSNKFLNPEGLFDIFWSELETHYEQSNNSNSSNLCNIYKLFSKIMNNQNNEHLNVFLQKKWYDVCDYLIKEKKIVANDANYISYVSSNPNINLFDEYFQELKYSTEHLRLACLYALEPIVKVLLNNKVIPTQNCYRALFEGKIINTIVIPRIIDILIFGGYNLSYDDIVFATKFRVALNKSIFTINFEPKEDFYEACTVDFRPEYNEMMYKNITWLRKWCKCANKGTDFTEIKRFIKKYNLKLDNVCKENLVKNNVNNKPKTELLSLCD